MGDQVGSAAGEHISPARPPARGSLVAGGLRISRPLVTEGVVVFVAYLIIAAAFTWPLVADPFTRIQAPPLPGERADQQLIMWILAWDWHALTTSPLSLFDANIYYPARQALAGSEHMLGVVPLSGPAYALTQNPLFAFNTAFLLTLASCGTAMYALLRHWGVVRSGAFFGGFVYAFHPGQIQGSSQLQLLSRQYLPLAILFFDRTVQDGRIRSAVAFAGFLAWQVLCSVYLAFISGVSLAVYGLVVVGSRWRSVSHRNLWLVAGAAVAAAALQVPIHLAYIELRDSGVIPTHEDGVLLLANASGVWRNWLLPPVAFREWGATVTTGLPSYLGLLPLCAAACTFFLPRSETSTSAARGALAMLIAGYVLALGPTASVLGQVLPLPYGQLVEWVPGFSSMRVPSRFSIAAMTGLSVLAGIGFGRLAVRLRQRAPGKPLIAAALTLSLLGTAIEYDLPFDRLGTSEVASRSTTPPVYAALAALPHGSVLELPWPAALYPGRLSSTYMLYSTTHWHPLLNGYTGHAPAISEITKGLVRALPDERALTILKRSTGLRYVVVHTADLPVAMGSRWNPSPAGLRRLDSFGSDLLFEVMDPIEPDLLQVLRDGPEEGHTLIGTRTGRLPKSGRRAEVRFTSPAPREVAAVSLTPIEIEVHNPTTSVWPSLTHRRSERVTIVPRLVPADDDAKASLARLRLRRIPLPYDLFPGERLRARFLLPVSNMSGEWRLEVGLAMAGRKFDGPTATQRIRISRPAEAAKSSR